MIHEHYVNHVRKFMHSAAVGFVRKILRKGGTLHGPFPAAAPFAELQDQAAQSDLLRLDRWFFLVSGGHPQCTGQALSPLERSWKHQSWFEQPIKLL